MAELSPTKQEKVDRPTHTPSPGARLCAAAPGFPDLYGRRPCWPLAPFFTAAAVETNMVPAKMTSATTKLKPHHRRHPYGSRSAPRHLQPAARPISCSTTTNTWHAGKGVGYLDGLSKNNHQYAPLLPPASYIWILPTASANRDIGGDSSEEPEELLSDTAFTAYNTFDKMYCSNEPPERRKVACIDFPSMHFFHLPFAVVSFMLLSTPRPFENLAYCVKPKHKVVKNKGYFSVRENGHLAKLQIDTNGLMTITKDLL
ncbi:hypothetical protein U9M48_004679 [Paspalum notatum var. saurae]|uniref:Uncharacterized protein n=1 Tax=Paspalum notatum var. saurae TaxID=547442 RepID=A0AAQ3SEZ9_PASNO